MPKNIIVADNLKFVSDSIMLQVQQNFPDSKIVAISSYQELSKIAITRSKKPDLIILDLGLTGMKSFYSVKSLREQMSGSPLLVRLPEKTPLIYLSELFKIGVSGVFSLDTQRDSLPHIINILFEGERYMPYELTHALLRAQEVERNEHSLSQREQEILTLLSIGVSNKEIARYAGIQSSTVKVHNKSIFRKLNVNSRTEAREKYFSGPSVDQYGSTSSTRL
jgi:two-component system, NarL family, nitrate/nitrite response regulator NarL